MIIIELICKERGQGKTTDLILKSARTGIPILVAHNSNFIVRRARNMGVKIPQPMNIREYDTFRENGSLNRGKNWNGKLLIDEIDIVLSHLLDADIEIATCTPTNEREINMKQDMNNELYGAIFNEPIKTKYTCDNNQEKKKSPNIKDIDIIVPNKVTEVTFVDGTKEKMILYKDDVFNLRNCLFIAIAKHLYKKDYTPEGIEYIAFRLTHLKKYVKIVDSALKAFEKKQKDIEKLEENRKVELERIERKRAKRLTYKRRRTEKKEQEEKEKQIEIQKEAYIRAMEYLNNKS